MTMAASETIDVGRLVDEQKLGAHTLLLLVLSFLAMMADGYDILALAYAAPDIVREWGVQRSALGPVFSAGLFGILFGAPLFGYVGDRFGRRPAIIGGCIIYGSCTLAAAWAPSLTVLTLLRFVTGIGIGGLMPNTIALNVEFAPKRWRATLVIVMFTGITLGGALPGWIAAWLVPAYGWQILFLIGGVGPLVIAGLLYLFLPESIRFLVVQGMKRERIEQLVRVFDPTIEIGPETRFVMTADEEPRVRASLRQLFDGGLAIITPLLWFLFGANLMATYFLNSWMPLLFQDAGMSAAYSALALSMVGIGGTVGGLTISVLLDRFGMIPVVVLFCLAAPIVALIGTPGLNEAALLVIVFFAGFSILGLQFGLNAISGLIYPTEIRSNGSGWAFAIGRFGSIVGPLLGGALIAMALPMRTLFYAPAASLALGAVAAIVMMRLCYARFGGHRLEDRQTT